MELYERLYDESERVNVQFVGVTTENGRFDFGIVFTTLFFGKPLITCMQTGKSCLLNRDDLDDLDHVKDLFDVHDDEEGVALQEFFRSVLPPSILEPQY
ncbi:DUF3055 domain-containing protein [Salisediminibacterium selenitireducens]|uniref:DUF3055 domain-containing protein n=1 Tax=Bacillus selenitireducens (strain ATCC 700615 / DSM 15326 / MLS10) TaxID=439292 RepID=D6XTI3_BACIE|nr:DUF3055 domain-containing protein [Salisediminibacterium selenitireducens]ADH99119.1 hypothetical protein Bsel_1609 [[Bacillus] selenitireducens MLS10]